MNRTALALIFAASLTLPATGANATIITFSGNLTGTQEVPPNASPGTGLATITIDDVTHTMLVDVSWSGLLSPTTIAHIHCCAAPGATAIPATGVPTFPGFPAGVTSGYLQCVVRPGRPWPDQSRVRHRQWRNDRSGLRCLPDRAARGQRLFQHPYPAIRRRGNPRPTSGGARARDLGDAPARFRCGWNDDQASPQAERRDRVNGVRTPPAWP